MCTVQNYLDRLQLTVIKVVYIQDVILTNTLSITVTYMPHFATCPSSFLVNMANKASDVYAIGYVCKLHSIVFFCVFSALLYKKRLSNLYSNCSPPLYHSPNYHQPSICRECSGVQDALQAVCHPFI